MTPRTLSVTVGDALRRQWWIVVIATVVATIAGYALALDEQTTYTASTSVQVDASILARVNGLPGPQRLLTAAQDTQFIGRVAQRTGTPASDLAPKLRAYTVGSPVSSFVLEYTGPDRSEAEKIVDAAAIATLEEVRALGATELGRQEKAIANTKALLDALKVAELEPGWERVDLAFRKWQAQRELADLEALSATYAKAYVYTGDVSVGTASAASKRTQGALGAAVAGLVAGVVLAFIRELLFLRSARD